MNALLTALVLLPSFCNFWAGSPAVVSAVGDSITVEAGGQSYAANSGWNTWDILHVNRTPEPPCANITPLQCEYDVENPRISLIQIGTNDPASWSDSWFSMWNLRDIAQYTAGRGILPILFTIPLNRNKDVGPINQWLREFTTEQGLPLIDFQAELESLPDHGLSSDGVHPSPDGYSLRAILVLEKLNEIRSVCGW